MTVYLYNIDTSPDHLRQSVSQQPLASYSGAARDTVSVDEPQITIQAQITTGNYVHIPEFGRYYYIRGRDIVRDDLTVLTLESDPLMSFAGQIDKLPAYVLRTSKRGADGSVTGYNADLPDTRVQCEQCTRSRILYLGSMPIQPTFYLVAVG